jgi:hypothetical protein
MQLTKQIKPIKSITNKLKSFSLFYQSSIEDPQPSLVPILLRCPDNAKFVHEALAGPDL